MSFSLFVLVLLAVYSALFVLVVIAAFCYSLFLSVVSRRKGIGWRMMEVFQALKRS